MPRLSFKQSQGEKSLPEHRLTPETIDNWLEKYPLAWRPKIPELDKLGKRIRGRPELFASLAEMREIVYWKRAGTGRLFERANSDAEVRGITQKAFAQLSERDLIENLKNLKFVKTSIASALLRFVFPERFGVVDPRNLYVLTHEVNLRGKPNELVGSPLMEPLGDRFGISTSRYLQYLKLLRKIASENPERSQKAVSIDILTEIIKEHAKRTVAEVDMAIFSYSWEFKRHS